MPTERLEARIQPAQKEILMQAAAITGRTLSEFIISASYTEALRTIAQQQSLLLSQRDSERFVKALLADTEPSPRLQRAAARYSEVMANQ